MLREREIERERDREREIEREREKERERERERESESVKDEREGGREDSVSFRVCMWEGGNAFWDATQVLGEGQAYILYIYILINTNVLLQIYAIHSVYILL